MAVCAGPGISHNGFLAARSALLNMRALKLLLTVFSTASAAPLSTFKAAPHTHEPEAGGAALWVLYVVSLVLVLLGGAFAGLTIALMGQDGIYLQVVARDQDEPQHKNAERVFNLLQRGKHWVLVTLLLSNVIVNETLPVVLDRCLGGGVAAVVGSTFLIVIFGEVLPQSICVRYGLQIGGYMAKPVTVLMYILAPIAWPTAKLLDKLLGEDHGTVYKKSGLKTLVTLHRTLGEVSERLNQDEVTIISAVLDLKEKPVSRVMTPMQDVFVMAADTVLDESTMDMILSAGYSRIPIHESGNPTNFVGMLLVKILITYDPEDCKLVRDFPLATLPETRPETSCLDIMNFFQEGKSHMVLVSERPGEDNGALGVVTLEDVIEELIGEEIIDESDVYVDVHKAIRRLTPAPKIRFQRRGPEEAAAPAASYEVPSGGNGVQNKRPNSRNGKIDSSQVMSSSPKVATFLMRRSSAGVDGQTVESAVPVRANLNAMMPHLRHLGPSNPATNPKNTTSRTVKIKPIARTGSANNDAIEESPEVEGDETTGLLKPQVSGKDGTKALVQSYGAVTPDLAGTKIDEVMMPELDYSAYAALQEDQIGQAISQRGAAEPTSTAKSPSDDGLASGLRAALKHGNVRSGSITENIIESRGVRKVVLETSSNDEDELAAVTVSSSPQQTKPPQNSTSLGFFPSEQIPEQESEGQESTELEEGSSSAQQEGEGRGVFSSEEKKKKARRKRHKGGSKS